eukprot:CAMPEP_0177547738 /NCGR_PEP_ID=MMETSP0369-20130122/64043_1 /TAXON_ID=447022 ORGANISM="Scrippsiella hangoei-like, Strain SHHI-4" /NCGR_SAMPLE_ID=MMETSP0369 /ASSEMBLY_ACC=CAM_ASM_000364 /LENGTH=137 /DNA_ID=CAMNT_0019032581 /DNA_START=1 /DNA_END=415 /DNA_ORIENTATION=-
MLGKGARDELTDALQGREAPHTKGKQSKFGEETMHDEKAAQVGEVLRNYLDASSDNERGCTLDQLLPPSATDKAIAAMTFHAILTLATAGHVQVEQLEPFSPSASSQHEEIRRAQVGRDPGSRAGLIADGCSEGATR